MEDSPEQFQIIENYSKCKFSEVCREFDKIKSKIDDDSIISPYKSKINQVLKENIIAQVTKSCTSIPTSMLAEICKEDQSFIINTINGLIGSNTINCKFDEVSKNITSHDINILDATVEKVNENTNKLYAKSLEQLIK